MASRSHGRIRKTDARDSLDSSEEDISHLSGEHDKILTLNMEDSVPGLGEELCPVSVCFSTSLLSGYYYFVSYFVGSSLS